MTAYRPPIRRMVVATAIAGSFLGATLPVLAQPSPGMTAPPRLIRLPNGSYTVPLRELEGSGAHGTASLTASGMKTLVTMHVYGPSGKRYDLVLHRGQDCSALASPAIPLRASQANEPTQTLVSIPLTNLSGNYVVEARDATEKKQYADACGKL